MKDKARKRLMAMLVCVALIMSSSISVLANDGTGSSADISISTDAEASAELDTSPEASEEPMVSPEASEEPTESPTTSPEPTASPEASEEPTASPEASEEPTASPEASEEPTASPEASQEPTASPEASAEPTASPEPSAAPTASPEPTATPKPVEKILITSSLELNSSINDNGDEDANTFEVVLEAWVAGTATVITEESEAEDEEKALTEDAATSTEEASTEKSVTAAEDFENPVVYEGTLYDASTILKNQISQYFDYYCSCEGDVHSCIKVYTSAWDGSQFLDPVEMDGLTVAVNGKTIEISGFDYNEHMVVGEDASGNGQKLIVKVAVEPKSGFWGGNNVPVTEDVAGVYLEGQVEGAFPVMSANIPLSVDITTKDKTIYYGGSISDADLLNGVTAGYKTVGTAEASGIVAVNEDGTLTPAEDWMDDYAVITWNKYASQDWTAAVGNIFGNAVSKIGTGCYDYAVTTAPRAEAVASETVAGAAISMEGMTDSDTGFSYVLVPALSFRNTVIYRGYVPDDTYFENYNKVSVDWIEMSGFTLESESDDDPYTYPAVDSGTEPALYFTYEPEDRTFAADTRVRVIVTSSNDNAEESVYMANAALFGGLIATLDTEAPGNTFTISVEYAAPFELPATGGTGTFGYRCSGVALLMCAVLLVWKKRRGEV